MSTIAELGSRLIKSAEGMESLDAVSKPLVGWIGRAVRPTPVRNLLSGTPLGHPAHPLLTDLPIGAWTMASLLDLIGGRKSRPAADLLVKAGIVSAVPTAATGLNDLSDTYGPETRLGLVHAAAVDSALLLYLLSARSRSKGHRARGRALGLLGLGALATGGYLGGHLSFGKGVNVNAVAHEYGPGDWTAVLAESDLADGQHQKVDAAGTAVLLYRSGSRIHALSNTCSHMGGPLDEGSLEAGCVTCPWHGSTFRLSDGSIVRGPACVPQPRYETRVNEGRIEVRSAS